MYDLYNGYLAPVSFVLAEVTCSIAMLRYCGCSKKLATGGAEVRRGSPAYPILRDMSPRGVNLRWPASRSAVQRNFYAAEARVEGRALSASLAQVLFPGCTPTQAALHTSDLQSPPPPSPAEGQKSTTLPAQEAHD